jgi:FkbM family methyltransferase
MAWVHHRWFINKRLWDDVQLNADAAVACDLWDEVPFGIWWGGETYENKPTPYFKSLLKPLSVVFDIGANVGYYSLTAAPLVGPRGSVYAFEPASRQFKRLKENASRNGFSQIHPYKLALSDKPGEAILHLEDESNTGSASLRPAGDSGLRDETVTCTTLDDFVESLGLDRIDAIKMDVEGYELAVLKGGQKALERFHPVLLVEVRDSQLRLAGSSRQELFDWLASRNYIPHRIASHARLVPIQEPENGPLVAFLYASQAGPN